MAKIRYGLILFLVVVLYFLYIIGRDVWRWQGLNKEYLGSRKKVEQEKVLRKSLKARIKGLRGSNQTIEDLARERLGFVKRGETAYKVIGK